MSSSSSKSYFNHNLLLIFVIKKALSIISNRKGEISAVPPFCVCKIHHFKLHQALTHDNGSCRTVLISNCPLKDHVHHNINLLLSPNRASL
ncbi:hypothetical protein HMPREF9261_1537 [Finegoldia magna ACS-171-V-Col3]|nr:hypothetical protein HMPREF9261_1537 [Finegoldia magna ACS-171-V-Col3]